MGSTCPSCHLAAEHPLSPSGLHACGSCGARFLPPGSTYAVLTSVSDSVATERVQLTGDVTDHWQLDLMLGAGAMGVVYAARDRKSGERVAIKFLSRVDSPSLRARFAREARTMGRVQHPNVVRVHEAGETHGYPFLVMELVDGMSLRDRVEREGALVPAEAIAVTLKLLEGLAYCHTKGVIHRDIKPENAMVTRDGHVRLADLGIALDTVAGTRMTASGVLVGTPAYMAPEVLQGNEATEVSDLYSVAVTLYELLTGNPPYSAKSFYDLVSLHYSSRPRPPHETVEGMSASLSAVVMRGLSLSPAARPATAEDFAEALRDVERDPTGRSTVSGQVPAFERPPADSGPRSFAGRRVFPEPPPFRGPRAR